MIVKVAKSAGFCFGVKRAVDKVYELIKDGRTGIYTLGPIIHNEEVVKDLEKKGVHVLEKIEDADKYHPQIVVIRSHGVPKSVYEYMEQREIEYLDVTCPFVKKIHKIVQKESLAGKHIVIIGCAKHPEVQGICGWAKGPVTVIETADEARAFQVKESEKICVVSQTTFNFNKFEEYVEILMKKGYDDTVVINTICNATEERQSEAENIAKSAEAMIVIGGKHSSNTQKLYEICKKYCSNTYYIQTLSDLEIETLKSTGCVGITAGASTPNNIIEEVSKHVRNEF